MRSELWAEKMYAGSWITTGATLDVTDKATGETIGKVADANAADIADACARADAVAASWAAVAPSKRASIIRCAGELMIEHKDEAVYWLVRETGSTRYKAEFEIAVTKD
jgi:benzaldehyde dehydrogenase (NAD)